MFKEEYNRLNAGIEKNRKIILSFGCSFAEGQGAIEQELIDNYPWYMDAGNYLKWDKCTHDQKQEIISKYPDIKKQPFGDGYTLGMNIHERYRNYGAQLAEMLGGWTPINFGMRGNGNRASVSQLFTHKEIKLHAAKEIIAIYTPAGMERFDFFQKENNDHHNFITMWPHVDCHKNDKDRNDLWNAYARYLHNGYSALQEQVLQVNILISWLKSTGANWKLLITPAYDRSYYREHWETYRYEDQQLCLDYYDKYWPTEYFFNPDGHKTFVNLVEAQEGIRENTYYEYMKTGSPGKFITPCAHPSVEGHRIFAEKLYGALK